MKTLLIMRHGKSSWKDKTLPDHDRPLKKRGRKDAERMAEALAGKGLTPEIILCSTAVRAQQTAEALARACNFTGQIQFMDDLYAAEPPAYLAALRTVPDSLGRALVIGHNPGLEELLKKLSGREDVSLSTAAVARLLLCIGHWTELDEQTEGEMLDLFVPDAK